MSTDWSLFLIWDRCLFLMSTDWSAQCPDESTNRDIRTARLTLQTTRTATSLRLYQYECSTMLYSLPMGLSVQRALAATEDAARHYPLCAAYRVCRPQSTETANPLS